MLDDGSYLSEITAICEYLEEKHPETPLIGSTAEERGETRMWLRKIDLGICENLANGFRFSEGLNLFKDRMMTLPEAAEGLKGLAQDRLKWLDEQMAGKTYICGDRLTLADIQLYCFLSFINNCSPRDGRMAFVRSPDNISIELLQRGEALPAQSPWSEMDNVGIW